LNNIAKPSDYASTNYDAALQELIDSFNPKEYGSNAPVMAPGTQNVSYFFSDGKPNASNGGGNGIQSGYANGFDANSINGKSDVGQANWEAFLNTNKVISYAIGLGTGLSATNLNPIGYNGAEGKDNNSELVKLVTDLSKLSDILLGSVPQISGVGGSLVDGTAGFGADGGYIQSVRVDGITYTFKDGEITAGAGADSENWSFRDGVLSVETAKGGELQLNMVSGAYNYAPPQSVVAADAERIDFIL